MSTQHDSGRRLIKIPEFAESVGISPHTAYLWARKGLLRVVRLSRLIRVPVEEVDRFVVNGMQPAIIEENTNERHTGQGAALKEAADATGHHQE